MGPTPPTSSGTPSRKPSPAEFSQVVLYDGVCNLCDSMVHFILPRDSRGKIGFASLQGSYGRRILAENGISSEGAPKSILLVEHGKLFQESTAILRAARSMDFPWNLFALGLIIPRSIRDGVYRWIARNRYRWFGKQESCLLPRPEWRARFIEPEG